MKKWSKPQLLDLSADLTEFIYQGQGVDDLWNEVKNPPADIPGGILGGS